MGSTAIPVVELEPEDRALITPERRVLLETLAKENENQEIYAPIVALLRTCDLEVLRRLAVPPTFLTELGLIESDSPAILSMWRERSVASSGIFTPPNQSPTQSPGSATMTYLSKDSPINPEPAAKKRRVLRSPADAANAKNEQAIWDSIHAKAKQQMKERAEYRCCITHSSDPDAAHIFPRSLVNKGPKDQAPHVRGVSGKKMWSFIRMFTTSAKMAEYEQEYNRFIKWNDSEFPPCKNYLPLRHDVQIAWAEGLFALKPVGDANNERQLRLQIVFRAPNGREPRTKDQIDMFHAFEDPKDADEIINAAGGTFILFRNSDRQILKNGDVIEVTTDDPVNFPFPSRTLLELKYFWTRPLTLCARSLDEENYDIDSDDDLVDPLHEVATIPDLIRL